MTSQTLLDILMITYNRPEYTKLALTQLLSTCNDAMRVWVWHNGNHEETLKVVRELEPHPQFHRLKHSPENKRLREPTNWFWEESDAPYVTKVDDDCLLPEGWAQTLIRALEANRQLGVIGCWRFYDEDYVPELAERKIAKLKGGHRIMRNAWVQGSGYAMRKELIALGGQIRDGESFPAYCVRASLKGWENGWYFPFIHEEHMDDPRSPYCLIKTDEDFMAQRPLSAINDSVTTVADWTARVKYMARSAQAANPDPIYHLGWRKKRRNLQERARRVLARKRPWD